ncbi:MAG: hypothetical protein NXI32_09240 [bacterium]|nr:hypothetical protein [bacterium]
MKLCIIGHARHGKDTVAHLLERYGLKTQDSSRFALRKFLFAQLAPKYSYKSINEAYLDRVNRRAEWYEAIREYNQLDRARLAKELLREADIYVGMRDLEEIIACKEQGIFDWIIWVDASKRKPPEDKSSFNISPDLANVVINNNDTEEQLELRVGYFYEKMIAGL